MRRVLPCLLLLVGCAIEPELVACPDDLICPAGTLCDPAHRSCIDPEQLTVCVDQAEASECIAVTVSGTCIDGVCLPRRCGDGVIEPGETCDDRNQDAGDGCNATCTSTEQCGNGVLDDTQGESCDDGNLLGSDGCDSTCGVEAEQWSVEGVAPTDFRPGLAVFDPVHHQLLHFANGLTWTWSGASWKLVSIGDVPIGTWSWSQLIFDGDRGGAVLIGGGPDFTTGQLWTWDGTTWTSSLLAASPYGFIQPAAIYDPIGKRALVLTPHMVNFQTVLELWSIDLAAPAWNPVTWPGGAVSPLTWDMAFDEARGVLVVVSSSATTTSVSEWDGTAWTTTTPATSVTYRSIEYDPQSGGVIAIGAGTASRWSGTDWVPVTAPPPTTTYPELVFDRDRNRLIAIFDTYLTTDIYEWDGAQWSGPFFGAPPSSQYVSRVYDTARSRLVEQHLGQGEAKIWSWNGDTWTLLGDGPVASYPSGLGYDPVRGGVIASAGNEGIWLLGDTTWTEIQAAGTGAGLDLGAVTFDPARRALVAIDPNGSTYQLRSDASAWEAIPDAKLPVVADVTLAADARNNTLVGIDATSSFAYELDDTWKEALSPGRGRQAVEDMQRGTVLLVGKSTQLWERQGNAWVEGAGVPYAIEGTAHYAPDRGELLMVGQIQTAGVILRRRFVSAAPHESCDAGQDLDGDGQAGCDDPDCWWACTPACPPYASCP